MAIWTGTAQVWLAVNQTSWRAAGVQFGEALVACGFVRAADTNQINWSTAIIPASTNTWHAQGEIFRFNDSLQATNPVFFKIEYGRGVNDAFVHRISFGTGSDGAGNLTGAAGRLSPVLYHPGASAGIGGTSTTYPSRASGDGSYFSAVFGENVAGNMGAAHALITLERSRNEASALDPAGVTYQVKPWATGTPGPQIMSYAYPSSGVAPPTLGYGQHYITLPYNTTSAYDPNGDVRVFPAVGMFPAIRPMMGALGYAHGDIPKGQTFSVNVLGAARTYYSVGDGGLSVVNGGTFTSIGIRYE